MEEGFSVSRYSKYVGLLLPATDIQLEDDMHERVSGARICTARMPLRDVSVEAEREMVHVELPAASRRVAGIPLNVVVFGCTSASVVDGDESLQFVHRTMQEITGAESVSVFRSVLDEIAEQGLSRLLVLTPYPEPVTAKIVETLRDYGVQVVDAFGLGISEDIEIGRVSIERLEGFAAEHFDKERHDGVFISCTNLPAAAESLGETLGVPVITSNGATCRRVQRLVSALASA